MQVREINVKFVFLVDEKVEDEDIVSCINDIMSRAEQSIDDDLLLVYSDNPDHTTIREATEEEAKMIEEDFEED